MNTLEIESGTPTRSVIWLHGLGANGHDFEPIVPELGNNIRFVFPHAPLIPVTLNSGYEMPAWYDIYSLTDRSKEDQAGMEHTRASIQQLIEHEQARGFKDIFLAGFSQGGAMALFTGLTSATPLAGIISLSGYLPLIHEIELIQANKHTPILLAHGTEDDVVPFHLAEQTNNQLTHWGYNNQLLTYPISHSLCPEEVFAIRDFLGTA